MKNEKKKPIEDELYYLFNNIPIDKEQPSSQKNALVKLLFKKSDHHEQKNCRAVSLLNTDYKILSKILLALPQSFTNILAIARQFVSGCVQ